MSMDDKESDLRTEYTRESLGQGVRGKYRDRYAQSHNVVVLEPEVADAFPTDEAVNEALLALIRIARSSTRHDR